MAPKKGSHPGRWTPEKIALALSLYAEGKGRETVAPHVGMSPRSVGDIVTRFGPGMRKATDHCRKYQPNEAAFDNAGEDEAKSYWLGFCFADASIELSNQPRQPSLSLELAVVDRCHVETFAQFLGLPKEAVCAGHKGASARVRIRSRRLVETLASYGVVPRKSFSCTEARPIGMANNRHFFRGLIDGDGCLSWSASRCKFSVKEKVVFNLLCSRGAVEQFIALVRSVRPCCSLSARAKDGAWTCATVGANAWHVIRHLYENCTVALPRKLLLATEIINTFDDTGSRNLPGQLGWGHTGDDLFSER